DLHLRLIMKTKLPADHGAMEIFDRCHTTRTGDTSARCVQHLLQIAQSKRLLQDAANVQPIGLSQLLYRLEQPVVAAAHQIHGCWAPSGGEAAEHVHARGVVQAEIQEDERASIDVLFLQEIGSGAKEARRQSRICTNAADKGGYSGI